MKVIKEMVNYKDADFLNEISASDEELKKLISSGTDWDDPKFKDFRDRRIAIHTKKLKAAAEAEGLGVFTPFGVSRLISSKTGLKRGQSGFEVLPIDVDSADKITIKFTKITPEVTSLMNLLNGETNGDNTYTIDRAQDKELVDKYNDYTVRKIK